MADNVTITNEAGDFVASADQATGSGAYVQRIKIAASADGSEAHIPADATSGLKVDLGADNDVTVSGTVAVSSIVAGTGATSLGKALSAVAGGSDTVVGIGLIRQDTPGTIPEADGDWTTGRTDSQGAMRTIESGAWSPSTDGVYIGASASGGYTPYQSIDLDEGTAEVIKASAGKVGILLVTNRHTADVFVKFFNRTSATTGTHSADWQVCIPAGAALAVDLGAGFDHSTGICAAATLGVALNDNTAIPSANLVTATVGYK